MIKNRNLTAITGLLLLSASLLSIFSAGYLAQKSIIERIETNAGLIANVVHESRKLYSNEVVDRLENVPSVEVSNRYRDYQHGIPNPATFTMLLGAKLTEKYASSNITIRMYSDMPFLNRQHRKMDAFSKEAMNQARKFPEKAYQLITTKNGVEVLRYADPMIMQESCIACHSKHPDSPKRDWKIGDVRGVLEITQPISNNNKSFNSVYLTRAFLTTIAIFTVAATLIMLIRNSREKKIQKRALKNKTAQLEKDAMTDSLTQIPNRRKFDIALEETWRMHKQNERPVSIVFIDIDFFKQYNDNLGHASGDSCLQEVALCLSQELRRPVDLIARYGGEEFALLLPDTDFKGVQQVVGNLRQAINKLSIPHPDSIAATHITVSLGAVTILNANSLTPESVINKADEALYEAKALGRNQAVTKLLD